LFPEATICGPLALIVPIVSFKVIGFENVPLFVMSRRKRTAPSCIHTT
jgi:hypothetical protein